MARTLAPVPLPGECIYSIASRFSGKWFRATRGGAGFLFGQKTAPVDRCLPRGLGSLATHLPTEAGLSAEDLALRHTALPLFLPFLGSEQANRVKRAAIKNGHLPFILGTAPSRIPAPKCLRVCELCLRDDIRQHGVPYFHCEAQVGGVLVCPRHEQPLSTTSLKPHAVFGSQRFASPDTSELVGTEVVEDQWLPHLIKIARDIAWLMEATAPAPGPWKLHAFYKYALHSKGYLRSDGSIRLQRLIPDFITHFGPGLLEKLHCTVSATDRGGWLGRLARRPRNSQHPLRHILLQHFLGFTCAEALVGSQQHSPAPAAPQARPHVNRIKCPQRLAQLLPGKRTKWLGMLHSPSKGSVRNRAPALYAWLWRNDRTWLRSNRPKPLPRRPNAMNWATRDQYLVSEIAAIAQSIRRDTPLRRVTRNAIASRIDTPSWLVTDHPHLPKSTELIKRLAESAADTALRRIRAAAQQFPRGCMPWRLRVAAGISTGLSAHPDVAAALQSFSENNQN